MSNLCDVGVDPRCWYPAVRLADLAPGHSKQVEFLGRSYVVYRSVDGEVHTLDNACAHRRVALHEGEVVDCRLVCPYHGWAFESDGRLAAIPYWPAEKPLPRLNVPAFPTRVVGGMVWFLPEPTDPLPPLPVDTSEWETDEWFSFRQDKTFANHYGVGLINGMDYFHFHLHRKYQPWSDLRLLDLKIDEGRMTGKYSVTTGRSRPERVLRALLGVDPRVATVTSPLVVHYLYPHHLAELGDDIKVWVFFRPIRRNEVEVFITTYIRARGIQRRLRSVFEPLFRRLVLRPIQAQDAWIGVLEQAAWEERPDEPRCEVNPVASAAERMIRSRWAAYLAQRGDGTADAWSWSPARRAATSSPDALVTTLDVELEAEAPALGLDPVDTGR